jgi:hypothetical protein
MEDKTETIGRIIGIMRNHWDLPADCNDGELFTYAEILFDRISAGEGPEELFFLPRQCAGRGTQNADVRGLPRDRGQIDSSVAKSGLIAFQPNAEVEFWEVR